ncbi:glutathione S-transferase [Lepidopterella palustris CBS 459.81]|uniref:glutathione transferase n=1 Tax=Lepidopterella palustris CBS 459.81 TaxID=1314670 RepID=A0A8E2E8Q6_9PEZI|nr:glutathione S-transferase [Lepidopterella palustris CBS 459.81]
MLTVYHLQRSQSERIVWLCEELGIPYELKIYARDPQTLLAPTEYKKLHPMGSAPVITDGSVTLAESCAITEYILTKYGGSALRLSPDVPNYASYLYWLHFANGSLQPAVSRLMLLKYGGITPENPFYGRLDAGRKASLKMMDEHLQKNKWLAGEEFTAADVMCVFSLTTMRLFLPFGLEEYPGLVAWLGRCGDREGYKRAMAKGDPGFTPALGVEAPESIVRGATRG